MIPRHHYFCLLTVVVSIIVFSSPMDAQFYQYTDKNGNVVVTDSPPGGSTAREKRLRDDGVYQSAPREAIDKEGQLGSNEGVSRTVAPKKSADFGSVIVVMYVTRW